MTGSLTPPANGDGSPASRRHGINCNEAQEIIPAVALGVAESAERLLTLAHCDRCPVCASALELARSTTAFLPFSVPLSTPDPRSKAALFARISTPAETTDRAMSAAIVDSPLAKRSAISEDPAAKPATPPTAHRPIARYAVAPLAVVLVIASFFAFRSPADQLTPGSGHESSEAAFLSSVTAVAAAESAPSQAARGVTSPLVRDATLAGGASITTPGVSSYITTFVSHPLYAISSRTNGSITESARSITPNDGICRLASLTPGKYHLSLSGVDLPDGAGSAGIYLATSSGERLLIARISIDRNGNGETVFTLDKPMSNYVTMLIGSGGDSAQPLKDVATFSLSSSDQFSTIGNSLST